MGVLRVDHPDILHFVRAKRNSSNLTGFNVSVGVTDKFMEALNGTTDRTCDRSGAKCHCFDLVL